MFDETAEEQELRGAIEKLMDEEEVLAEDPTQNALLAQAPSVPVQQSHPVEPQQDESGTGEMAVEEPAEVVDESASIQIPEPEEVSDESNSVQLPDTHEVVDESNLIPVPEPQEEAYGDMSIDEIEPMQLPPIQLNNERPDPDWEDAMQDMLLKTLEGAASTELDNPPEVDSVWDELDWKSALSDRSNSL